MIYGAWSTMGYTSLTATHCSIILWIACLSFEAKGCFIRRRSDWYQATVQLTNYKPNDAILILYHEQNDNRFCCCGCLFVCLLLFFVCLLFCFLCFLFVCFVCLFVLWGFFFGFFCFCFVLLLLLFFFVFFFFLGGGLGGLVVVLLCFVLFCFVLGVVVFIFKLGKILYSLNAWNLFIGTMSRR